jgi:hypothetical protein
MVYKKNPPFLSKEKQRKKEKNKSLDIEQLRVYGHGSQRGSMPGVTVLAEATALLARSRQVGRRGRIPPP